MEHYYSKISFKRTKLSSIPQASTDLGESANLGERANESEIYRSNEAIDLNSLHTDPGERLAIRKYHPNDHDAIRRSYLQQGPFQP